MERVSVYMAEATSSEEPTVSPSSNEKSIPRLTFFRSRPGTDPSGRQTRAPPPLLSPQVIHSSLSTQAGRESRSPVDSEVDPARLAVSAADLLHFLLIELGFK